MKIGRGNRNVLGENLPQRHFVHPSLRGGKPATNRLSCGAALHLA
jgi:hypothetical protein